MADNYLERRMEDLRQGRIRKELTRKRRRLPMEGQRVLIAYGLSEKGREMVKYYRERGAKVDFAGVDRKEGAKLAQSTGACFHPLDDYGENEWRRVKDEVIARRHGVDISIVTETLK